MSTPDLMGTTVHTRTRTSAAPSTAPLLHERVSAACEAWATETAVVMGSQRLSYEELEQASNRLARMLIAQGVKPGERVCLLQPKTPAAIVSMLATLKTGGVYVPIDVASPAARVQMILDSAKPCAVLACEAAGALTQSLLVGGARLGSVQARAKLGSVEGALERAAFQPADTQALDDGPLARVASAARDSAHAPAHILFTSGSTGTPKGVVITHAMVAAFLDWALPYFGHRPGDRISGHPPLHFDLSTFDIYGTLSSGGELHLVGPDVMLPAQLARFIREAELTQWFSVPSTFAYMVRGNAIGQDDFPSLERILWCGEVLPPAVLLHWMKRVATAQLHQSLRPHRGDHRLELPHRRGAPARHQRADPDRQTLRRRGHRGARRAARSSRPRRDRRALHRGRRPEPGLLAGRAEDTRGFPHGPSQRPAPLPHGRPRPL